MLEIELLKAFVAVAENRSFTRAADFLHRTQSAVSMQIRRLEEAGGSRLFERSRHRVGLTRDGEALLGYARRMLALHDEALAQLGQSQIQGSVRIGAMEDYATRILPRVLADFAATHPLVHVELETGLTGGMVDRVGSRFDLVLAIHPEGGGGGELVRREMLTWATGLGHSPHLSDPLPLALYQQGCSLRAWAQEALDGTDRRWRLAYVSSSLGSVEAAAAAGLAVTVVKSGAFPAGLRPLAERDGLPPLPPAEIRLHRSSAPTKATAVLGDYIREALSGPLGAADA
jgi:DNA-binding transcriptional LysR family regulator